MFQIHVAAGLCSLAFMTISSCSANVTTREKATIELEQNSAATPLSLTVTASPFLQSSPFRLVGVSDEIFLTVSADRDISTNHSFQCSFAGAAFVPCQLNDGKLDVSSYDTGGALCVTSSENDESVSEPACVSLPAFTSVTCDESITSDTSFEAFHGLLGNNKTICLEDGVTVSNEPESEFGSIQFDYANVTIIARTGQVATIHNKRDNASNYGNSAALYPTGDGLDVVGLTIKTAGSHGVVIFGWHAKNVNIIANKLHALGTAQRIQGIIIQGTDDATFNGSIIGNDIIAGDGDNSRGIELRYVDAFTVEDNSIETHCDTAPYNTCPALYIKQSANKAGGPFHINRNRITHSGQSASYALRLETALQDAVVESFNDNHIQLATDSASQIAIYSTTSVVEARGNTICPLGTQDFSKLVYPDDPVSGNVYEKLMEADSQAYVSLTEPCP